MLEPDSGSGRRDLAGPRPDASHGKSWGADLPLATPAVLPLAPPRASREAHLLRAAQVASIVGTVAIWTAYYSADAVAWWATVVAPSV